MMNYMEMILRTTLLLTELVKVLPKGKQTSTALFKMAIYWDISSARWIPSTSSRTIWDQSKYAICHLRLCINKYLSY